MESILLMIAIDFHEQSRREVERLTRHCENLRAAGVDCRLIDRRLEEAREMETRLRDELLRCPVRTDQDAATKAVHLRQVLYHDRRQAKRVGAPQSDGYSDTYQE
ncbi:hypothetical protein [Phyllobacterium lublinensis]|uniref:hypothetical protein n=1 Tax=Phyllobacterium lublinensis TaxID=2875708 RepID=UPI001CC97285|nr:hypothetical protein [Phyllobacterium sp. 2063]MBZ9654324.1 hypothetical protein [Phyllobacterium sp. 2063]